MGIEGLEFLDEVESVQAEVNVLLDQGVNKIIALGHSGMVVGEQIAAQVRGVDVVICGHHFLFLYTGMNSLSKLLFVKLESV